MAGKNEVKLSFAGDASSLDRATAKANQDLDGFARKSKDTSHAAEGMGDSIEGSAGKFRGGADAVDGMSAVLGTLGVAIPGPVGGIITMGRGLADLADGIGGTVLPMLKAMKVSMLATLGPWGLAALAVAALVAGFVIAYKKSETFRNIVNGVANAVKTAVRSMAHVITDVAKALSAPYRLQFNLIADAWNNTIGRLSFSIPGWVPGLGGKGFSVPQIPHFATGGVSGGGLAVVGERGPEMVRLPTGSRVFASGRPVPGQGGGEMTLRILVDGNGVFQGIRKETRTKFGGNVQMAFGS